MSDLNRPEPAPVVHPDGVDVWPDLIAHVRKATGDDPDYAPFIADMEERHAFGVAKYGQPLRTLDGRNTARDAYQEALDLLVYLWKLHIEEGDPTRGRATFDLFAILRYLRPLAGR